MIIADKKQQVETILDKIDMILKTLQCEEIISDNTFKILSEGMRNLEKSIPTGEDFLIDLKTTLQRQNVPDRMATMNKTIYTGILNNHLFTIEPLK